MMRGSTRIDPARFADPDGVDTGPVSRQVIGHAVVVSTRREPGEPVRLIASRAPEDHENTLVILDLPGRVPIAVWEAVAASIGPGSQGIRLIIDDRSREMATLAAGWLSERLDRAVVLADGPVTAGPGTLLVGHRHDHRWRGFVPGRVSRPGSRRFPRPVWDDELTALLAGAGPGVACEPLPAGAWIRPAADDAASRAARARLLSLMPMRRGFPTIVLGSPGVRSLQVEEVHRLRSLLPESTRRQSRMAAMGPIALPEGKTLGQALADLSGEETYCYTGIPVGGTADAPEIRTIRTDGRPGPWPYALELRYRPQGGLQAPAPEVTSHRPPFAGLNQVVPGAYRLRPDTILEVVQAGLLLRPATETGQTLAVRRVGADERLNLMVVDAQDEQATAALHQLAGALIELFDESTRRSIGLVPAGDLLAAGAGSVPVIMPGQPRSAPLPDLDSGRTTVELEDIAGPVAAGSAGVADQASPWAPPPGARASQPAPQPFEPVSAIAASVAPVDDPVAPPAVTTGATSAPVNLRQIPQMPTPPSAADLGSRRGAEESAGRTAADTVGSAAVPVLRKASPDHADRAAAPTGGSSGRSTPAADAKPAPAVAKFDPAVVKPAPAVVERAPAAAKPAPAVAKPTSEGESGAVAGSRPKQSSGADPAPVAAGARASVAAEAAVEPGAQPEAPEVGPSTKVRFQTQPERPNRAVLPSRPIEEERQWLRRTLGARYGTLSNAMARILSEHPGFEGLGAAGSDAVADAVAVRLYLSPEGPRLNDPLRAGAGGPHVPFARCIVAGLGRLPSHRGPASFALTPSSAAWQLYERRPQLTEWGFMAAGAGPADPSAGDTDVMIWSLTGRRTALLEPPAEDVVPRVVFVPGTRLKVLEVTRPENDGRGLILMREVTARDLSTDQAARNAQSAMDEMALNSLRSDRGRWSAPARAARPVLPRHPVDLVPTLLPGLVGG